MGAFKKYLASAVLDYSPEQLGEMNDRLSNWSYLHLSFMEREPTETELEALMYVELTNRNRAHILHRLHSRWQKCQKERHYKELRI